MDRRSFTICRINNYERVLQLIGYMSNNSDKNANDSSKIDSVVDAADVGEFIVLLLAIIQETQNETFIFPVGHLGFLTYANYILI